MPPWPSAENHLPLLRRRLRRAGERADGDACTCAAIPTHPANLGRLCSKGAALGETLSLRSRLLYPEVDGRRVTLGRGARHGRRRLPRRSSHEHGPDAVAFYVSGQLLTEDYYVANKLMKGFIGSGNIDTNSRLCMSSAVAGHKRAFGDDMVPGCYEDLELADLVVLVGSNTAWCHPVLYPAHRRRRKQERPGLQRRGHRPAPHRHLRGRRPAPGRCAPAPMRCCSTACWRTCAREDALDCAFLERTPRASAPRWPRRAPQPDIAAVAQTAAWPRPQVRGVLRPVRAHRRVRHAVLAGRQPVILRHRQGQRHHQLPPGSPAASAGPAWGRSRITGQPNAMGGREVGGLANQLAAHMDFDRRRHRERGAGFWSAPRIAQQPGLKAVDLFRAVERRADQGAVDHGHQPGGEPAGCRPVRRALRECDLVVVSDCVAHTDTTPCAHVLLPAAAWGEKDGTVTNSERRISRQRAFLPPPGEARPDWWIVARWRDAWASATPSTTRMPPAIFREHAALSAVGNDGKRDFDLSGLAEVSGRTYDALAPVQWPVRCQAERHRADVRRRPLLHAQRPARFLAITPRPPAHPTERYPLVLNTGRVRDQWHTMTRTGLAARLSAHTVEPYVEIHPPDAVRFGVADGALARVARSGASRARVCGWRTRNAPARCSCRCTGATSSAARRIDARGEPGHRSHLRRTGVQAHPGAHRAIEAGVVRLSAVAPQAVS